jgi:hypothetical protein
VVLAGALSVVLTDASLVLADHSEAVAMVREILVAAIEIDRQPMRQQLHDVNL